MHGDTNVKKKKRNLICVFTVYHNNKLNVNTFCPFRTYNTPTNLHDFPLQVLDCALCAEGTLKLFLHR